MKQYILKDGQLDGIYEGIGAVETGKPITVRNDVHEAALAAHPAFKQYRAPKDEAAPLTPAETVEAVEAPAPTKPAKRAAASGTKE